MIQPVCVLNAFFVRASLGNVIKCPAIKKRVIVEAQDNCRSAGVAVATLQGNQN